MAPDGTREIRLTDSSHLSEIWASFSPDGTRIVYNAYPTRRSDPQFFIDDIYTIALDGTDRERVTHTRSVDEFAPSWQPT